MVMLSITGVTLTPLSDGKGHAGKVLQHSHAGGYDWLCLDSQLFHKGFPTVTGPFWDWTPPMSPDLRVLLPVEMSQRRPQDVLCSSTGRAEHNYLDIGANQSVHSLDLQFVSLSIWVENRHRAMRTFQAI